LAKSKGYSAVAATDTNLFFVNEKFLKSGDLEEISLEKLLPNNYQEQFIFVGYDGTLLSNKDFVDFVWQGIKVPIDKFQFFPKNLRFFPDSTMKFWTRILNLWLKFKKIH